MKILHIVPTYYPCLEAGGVVNAVYQLGKKQAQNGNEVTVFTTDSCTERLKLKKRYNIPVDGVKAFYFRNLLNSLKSKFLIDTPYALPFKMRTEIKKYEIVHIHEHRHFLAIIASYYARKNNIPYVIQSHGSVLPFFQKERLKDIFDKLWGFNILKNASKAFALTEIEKKQYMKMGIKEENIEIVPLGIDIEEYKNLPPKGNFRKKYHIKNDEKLLLFVGRINKIKGLDLLIKSFSILNNENINGMNETREKREIYENNKDKINEINETMDAKEAKDAKETTEANSVSEKNKGNKGNKLRLAIVGPDNGFLDELKNFIDRYDLKNKVIITGPLFNNDKKEALVDCDIFIMPSRYESFTTSGLEAMACGKPLVLTKNNHIHTWVNNNVGFSADYDEKDLSNKIVKLLKNDELMKTFGKNGMKEVKDKYNWDSIEKKIISIYKEVV
jgi:glycosyltransferase involved in cell wall biosynthesis